MTIHQPYAVEVNGTLISACSTQSVSSQSTISKESYAGSPFAPATTINGQTNQAETTTMDLEVALGLLGYDGVPTNSQGVRYYQLQLDPETGLPDSNPVHNVLQIDRGKTCGVRLSCNHQADASLDIITHALVDRDAFNPQNTATWPVTPLSGQDLPTGLAGNHRWSLGDIQVGGVVFDCPLSVSIDFGITLTPESCGSDTHPDSLIWTTGQPVIRIRGRDLDNYRAEFPEGGRPCSHLDTEIFLRRRLEGQAHFDLPSDPTHIKCTAKGVAHWVTLHDSQNNNRIENEIQIDCGFDLTNRPIVLLTGQTMA